jgi:hypothetical protein
MPAKTPFRVDTTGAQRKLQRVKKSIRANDFRAQLMDYLRKTLTTAAQITPERNATLIRSNQTIQYAHRINYIPSYHELTDPMLIVNDAGEHWIHCNGDWYRGDWRLPDEVYAAYQDLLGERDRRMQTPRQSFINERSQARFLYKKSWWEVGKSVGLDIPAGQAVKSFSRHNPRKEPPKGYAQIRGGKDKLAVDVRNPFLEEPSQYKSFSGRAILAQAANRHRPAFQKALGVDIRKKVKSAQ